MANDELTAERRRELLAIHQRERQKYNATMDSWVDLTSPPGDISELKGGFGKSYALARESLDKMEAAEVEYFAHLPRITVSTCPFCQKPLFRSVDVLGLDGFWWRSDASPQEPQPCSHFCVLLGAVSLGSHSPLSAFDIHPGPGAPFVLPRLLALPEMTAVVSAVSMIDGATAYPVAYFARRRPPVQLLTASWARTNFVYTTQLGEHGWRRADELPDGPGFESRDFALRQWLMGGQLRWCDPAGDRTMLSPASPSTCPFLDIPGPRVPQVIRASSG